MVKKQENVQAVLESVQNLPLQYQQAWKESLQGRLPNEYKKVREVVVCGMGGSALPTHIIQSLNILKCPLYLVNDYMLPSWVGRETLVILASYSGNTEEVLSAASEAKRKKCKIVGITSGGMLGEWLKKHRYPSYLFNPIYNPSKQPRIGLGYGLLGQLGLLANLDLVSIQKEEVENSISSLLRRKKAIFASAASFQKLCREKVIIIFASRHLVGNAHVFANQINETDKTLSMWFAIPEANHHLLEGLKRPRIKMVFFFIDSKFYTPKIRKRIKITKEIIKKHNYSTLTYLPKASLQFAQTLETLLFTSFFTFKLALFYKEDPTAIPWVDYFKRRLKEK